MADRDSEGGNPIISKSDITRDFGGPRCSLEDEERFVARIREDLKEKIISVGIPRLGRIAIEVHPENIIEVALYLKTQALYDAPMSVTGIDFPEENIFEVLYHLVSYEAKTEHPSIIQLRTKIARANPSIPSLIKVWAGVEWHERETHEMLGIVFEGHPNLGGLLLPETWDDIPPLRKDFILPVYRKTETPPTPREEKPDATVASEQEKEE
ncbi:MAG: NADH-quinone oxidoreductase subunit C [Candidatus Ranarchaeia archaeon]